MPLENYYHTLFSWRLIQTLWKYGKYELNKTSKVGRVAPNPPLVAGEKGQSVVHLLDLVKGSRPLVVVFGSCTCPVIIAKLDQMLDVHREFGNIADFIMIYVQEAHPYNGWKMEVRLSFMTTHITLDCFLSSNHWSKSFFSYTGNIVRQTHEPQLGSLYSLTF